MHFFKRIKQTKFVKNIFNYCIKNLDHTKNILFIVLVICLLELPDILGAYIYGFKKNFWNAYTQAMRINFVFIAPLFFLPGKIGKIFFGIITSVLSLCALAVVILYKKFRLEIGGDSYFVIANSNPSETHEFLISLLSGFNIFAAVTSMLFALFCIVIFSRCKWKITYLHIITGIIMLLPLSITILRHHSNTQKMQKVFSRNSLSKFILEYNTFQSQYGNIYKNLTEKPDLPSGLKALHKNIAGIIVIGESANRNHLGIYGYPRNTTPNLLRRKDSILAFSNVISATVQTPTAIRYLLTDELLSSPGIINFSLPDLLNAAGFKTHWISNQFSWGLGGYESSTTLLAQKCNSFYFVHQETPDEKYDIACVEPAKKMLNTEKPVILFVHLQGSHIGYESRFPKNFGSFKNTFDQISQQTLPANRNMTNIYDCSIEYTDFVLEKLIKQLEKQSRPSFLLYVSDHSECNNIDNHTVARAAQCNIRACYEIPFLLWFSPEYKKLFGNIIEKGKKNLKSPLQADRAIWTITDIVRISWDGFPEEKSLFSSSYKNPSARFMFSKKY